MRWINSIKRHPLTVAFALPIIIMGIYFCACQHVYPFGNSSLLTVDMGQQYIDFYAYFRQTLLGHPGQFFLCLEQSARWGHDWCLGLLLNESLQPSVSAGA